MKRFALLPVAGCLMLTAALAAETELRPPGAFSEIEDDTARAVALFEEMSKVIAHPRCMNCHPRDDIPRQGDESALHQPPVIRGKDDLGTPGMPCATCHGGANVDLAGVGGIESVPGHEPWHLAPDKMGWIGLSLGEICGQISDPARNGGRTLADIHAHHAYDRLVGWAWQPGDGRTPAPGSQELFGALTQAWIDAGAHCPE